MTRGLLLDNDVYHRPKVCEECGGVMIFDGVGEYHCEDCGLIAYDDYGKVRCYIEKHPGATASTVEAHTGVSQKTIRQMLKDDRIQIAEDSAAFLKCERCGAKIRSGRFCAKCEVEYHRDLEEEQRRQNKVQGFGKAEQGQQGEKRYKNFDVQ